MKNSASTAGNSLSTELSQAEIDPGLRQFLISVYNYMASGLALTGVVAYVAAEYGFYAALLNTPVLFWGVVLAPLVLVFFLSIRIEKMSLGAVQAGFWVYAGLVGLSLAGVFLVYAGTSIARTFFIAAATFLAMSFYGYTTRTDLARFGSFLMMGLVGIIIASLVNLFLASSTLQLVVSFVGVIIRRPDSLRYAAHQEHLLGKRQHSHRWQEGDYGRAHAVPGLPQPIPPAIAIDR